jgi:Carboxypeptidase regulatory-like domain
MRRLAFGLYLTAFVCVAAPAMAQQGTTEIGGRVVDTQGAVLPGVNVVITNEDTGATRELVSGGEGSYFASQLVPGRYRITAKLEGFKALDRRGITLTVGQTTTLDLTMEVGGLTETLTVTGEAALVDVTSAEIGGHITATELNDLPSANRNYMAFIGNAPGTVFVASSEFLNDSFQANGQPTAANNIVFDGANNTDDQRGSNVGGQTRAANESIAEVQILTNQFDAEWGRASGAVINAVTKSGTNNFSGSAFNFYTSKGMTGKDFFTKAQGLEKPDVGKKEWGGTVGGPIVRNKLHFFFSLERIAQSRNFTKSFSARPEYSTSVGSEESAWNYLWRIDHQINSNHSWAFRWLQERAPQFLRLEAEQETIESYNDETDFDRTMVGTLTSVVSDTKVNTVRVGFVFEDTVHANPAWRALDPEFERCVPCPDGAGLRITEAAPRLDYDTLDIQAATTMDYSSIQRGYSIDDTFSWFVPEKMGRHDMKFGVRYSWTTNHNPIWSDMNGSYQFRGQGDIKFDPANPRSYPERLAIRVLAPSEYKMKMHIGEFFAQDKWQMKPGLTLSAGVRYDIEVFPYEQDPGNPLFQGRSRPYAMDANNIAPRLGLVWNPDGESKSVVRVGYGMFYDRTLLGTVDNFLTDLKYAKSFVANFPQAGADTGPRNGRFPTDPTLNSGDVSRLTPAVRSYINSVYPPGTTVRNSATVTWDDPNRAQPYFHQFSAGYEREVFTGVSVSTDYIRMSGHDMFFNPNLNIPMGLDTVRDGPNRVFLDPYGVLNPSLLPGEPAYNNTVRLLTTQYGFNTYDALNLSVEKRYSNSFSLRGAYSYSLSRGVAAGQGDTPQLQVGTDLKLDEYDAPSGTSRAHNGNISGRLEIPKTRGLTLSGTIRMMTGERFTIQDDTLDLDMNRINFQPLPAGTYNPDARAGEHVMRDVENTGGRNGAVGPGFMQLDMRIGYRARLGGRRTLDIFGEMFNLTDRANFTNPSGNRRVIADFLRLTGLAGGTGFPRQGQIGLRLGF